MKGFRILVVDDNEKLKKSFLTYIEKHKKKFNVEFCNTTKEALKLIDKDKYHLIVSNHNPPSIDGIELLTFSKSRHRRVPFIFYLEDESHKLAINALNLGLDFYLLKKSDFEIQFKTIVSKIEELIENYTRDLVKEKRFQTIFDESISGIVLIDLKTGRIVDSNKEFEKQTGRTLKELKKLKIWEIRPKEKWALAKFKFKEIIGKGKGSSINLEFEKPNGEIIPISFSSSFITINNDKYLQSITTDISEINKINQNLRNEKNILKTYFDKANIIIVVLDKNKNVLRINEKGCSILGYTEEEIIGKNWIENFIPERLRKGLNEVFQQCIDENTFANHYENQILAKDGSEYLIAWDNTTLKDENNNLVAVLSSGIDITFQHLIQHELVESEKRYRFFFDNLPIPVALSNDSGELQKANKALIDFFGIDDEIYNVNLSKYYFDPNDRIKIRNLLQKYNKVVNFESKLKIKNNNEVDVRFTVSTMVVENIKTFLTIIEDVTEQKQLESEQKKLLKALDQIEESIVIVDSDSKIIYVNSGFEKFTGYSLIDAFDATPAIMRYIDEEYTEEFYKEILRITESGKVWQGTVRIKRKDGEIRIGERIISPIQDEKGKITHFVAATRDITDQFNQHQKLVEMEKMHLLILENIQDVFFITDIDGTIVDFNSQAEKLFGFTREELLQINGVNLYAKKEDRKILTNKLQKEGKVENYLIKMKKKNGSIFQISLNAFLRKDDNGENIRFIGILREVSS